MDNSYNKDTQIIFRVASKEKAAFKEAAKILKTDISKILTDKVKSVIKETGYKESNESIKA